MLIPEQARTLDTLVEAVRSAGDAVRQPFMGFRPVATASILVRHPGLPNDHPGFYQGDLEELEAAGLIRFSRRSNNTWIFDVTSQGFAAYTERQQRQEDRDALVEDAQFRWLDTSGFLQRYPEAAAKVRQAMHLLVEQDVDEANRLTVIGHLCREAQQAFATSLLGRFPRLDAPANPANVVARLRTVIAAVPNQSETVQAFMDALLVYWGTLSDLIQRQEHGAQREGHALTWEDARRIVFNSLFVMCEVGGIL